MTLAAHGISVRLGRRRVLDDVSVHVAPGELVALLGPNGCGKSTTMRALAGVQRIEAGSITLDGVPLARIAPRRRAQRLAFVAQAPATTPAITVRQHVALGRHPHRPRFGAGAPHDARIVDAALRRFGVLRYADTTVDALSGGERQRVRLATALAQQPRYLLLDEPLNGLDIEHQLDLLALLRELATEHDLGVLVVLHDFDHTVRTFDRTIVMHAGRVRAADVAARALCPETLTTCFGVDGCVSRDEARALPVVVCQRHVAPPSVSNSSLRPGVTSMPANRCPFHAAPERTASVGLADRLRHDTREQHERAEAQPFQQRFVTGAITAEEYGRFLEQMRAVHVVLDDALRRTRAAHPAIAALHLDRHDRVARLNQDLADLDRSISDAPLPATVRFTDAITAFAASKPAALIGVLYVKEGATNGNKIVVRRITDALELAPGVASRYLDPYGADQRKHWMAFREMLETLPLTDAEQDDVVAGAAETFEMIMAISTELEATCGATVSA